MRAIGFSDELLVLVEVVEVVPCRSVGLRRNWARRILKAVQLHPVLCCFKVVVLAVMVECVYAWGWTYSGVLSLVVVVVGCGRCTGKKDSLLALASKRLSVACLSVGG